MRHLEGTIRLPSPYLSSNVTRIRHLFTNGRRPEVSPRTNVSARQPLADDRVEALWVLYVADVRARVDQLVGDAGDESVISRMTAGGSVLSAANEERWAFDPAQMVLVVKLVECAGAADITSRARIVATWSPLRLSTESGGSRRPLSLGSMVQPAGGDSFILNKSARS
jgi:hypothetical protein